jgi:hypothetical protein
MIVPFLKRLRLVVSSSGSHTISMKLGGQAGIAALLYNAFFIDNGELP